MKTSIRCIAALLACWSMGAGATLVSYSSTCASGCEAVSLSTGDAVSAQFQVDTVGSLANLALTKANVSAFSIHFGSIDFVSADLSNWDFDLHTDAFGAVNSMHFIASFGTTFADLGRSVDIRSDAWYAAQKAVCSYKDNAAPCDVHTAGAFSYIGTPAIGKTVAVSIANVPEPASIALVALGFIGIAAMRRGRKN